MCCRCMLFLRSFTLYLVIMDVNDPCLLMLFAFTIFSCIFLNVFLCGYLLSFQLANLFHVLCYMYSINLTKNCAVIYLVTRWVGISFRMLEHKKNIFLNLFYFLNITNYLSNGYVASIVIGYLCPYHGHGFIDAA